MPIRQPLLHKVHRFRARPERQPPGEFLLDGKGGCPVRQHRARKVTRALTNVAPTDKKRFPLSPLRCGTTSNVELAGRTVEKGRAPGKFRWPRQVAMLWFE
jgi:hypothetical protein